MDFNYKFSKEELLIGIEYFSKYLTTLDIKKILTTLDIKKSRYFEFYLTSGRMEKTKKKSNDDKFWHECGEREIAFHC